MGKLTTKTLLVALLTCGVSASNNKPPATCIPCAKPDTLPVATNGGGAWPADPKGGVSVMPTMISGANGANGVSGPSPWKAGFLPQYNPADPDDKPVLFLTTTVQKRFAICLRLVSGDDKCFYLARDASGGVCRIDNVNVRYDQPDGPGTDEKNRPVVNVFALPGQ